MYIKSLTINHGDGSIIRYIPFYNGLNLIIDETPSEKSKNTGNNVGKTTIIKLIDFCLGGDGKDIYRDTENKRNEYKLVKDFLINNRVLITLVLQDDLTNDNSRKVVIKRNFLPRKLKIQSVDEVNKTDDEFEEALTNILFPGHYGKKPTFHQIIGHNIRYTEHSLENTIKHIHPYTRIDEYETLFLFLFGVDFNQGHRKQELRSQIDFEEKFKKRLESEQTRSGYESALALILSEIKDLEEKKSSIFILPDMEKKIEELNDIKYQINFIISEINRIEIRKKLILEAQNEMQNDISKIDVQQIHQIYEQAVKYISGIQKTFQELLVFHNRMVEEKIKFIVSELPSIEGELRKFHHQLDKLLLQENEINHIISQSSSFSSLEQIISELNGKYQMKGSYEQVIVQLQSIENKLADYYKILSEIDNILFSDEFSSEVKIQINKFNRFFSSVSNELYGEKFILKSDMITYNGRRYYEFSIFDANNFGSGKKQGEAFCFDFAYTLFADEENIPCMHFLLNDKKELLHVNQLIKIAKLVNETKIQFVASILQDKLPDELNKEEFIIVRLSQNDKLFRIEE